MSVEEFILRACEVHGNKYDYSKVEYKNSSTKVCIICPIHGAFWQAPNSHLQGCGCPECARKSIAEQNRYDIELFIEKARAVHGDKFGYDLVNYIGCHENVTIICPIHGEFRQKPSMHLSGHGCPRCNESHGEREIAKWLDNHNIKYQRQYKVIPEQVLFGRNKFMIDFYLPDHNIFIEFHGEQHYRRVKSWHTEEQFADQQDRDRRLREYCKQHKIRLIEIPYIEFDNIDKILTRKILRFKIK